MTTRIDPGCPTGTDSHVVTLLRVVSWLNLVLSTAVAIFIWIFFRQIDVPVGVGTPLPVIEYDTVTNWAAIGVGTALLIQGIISYAALQALASITQDVTGIRISSKAAAVAASAA